MKHGVWLCGLVILVGGCGIEDAIRRNDDRYMQPGALDFPLTGIYDTYQYKFLDKYRITHHFVNSSGCEYRAREKPSHIPGKRTNFYIVPDIYEQDGHTWQVSNEGGAPWSFDTHVRSVKYISKEKGREGLEMEIGFKPVCFEYWWVASVYFRARLHKRDLATWRAMLSQRNPKGKWSERRVGANAWLVQETVTEDFSPRPLNGVGGPFQFWLLPIGDTGYTYSLELGASKESLQYPEALARFASAFRHLIESVQIEPFQP